MTFEELAKQVVDKLNERIKKYQGQLPPKGREHERWLFEDITEALKSAYSAGRKDGLTDAVELCKSKAVLWQRNDFHQVASVASGAFVLEEAIRQLMED